MRGKGFTLVELLVVIAIIAILSVVGAVVFRSVTSGARDAARKADVDAIAKAYEIKYNSTGSYQALADADFASGKIPTPPEGGNYFNVSDKNNSGSKVCAALENKHDPMCNTPTANCYCVSSSQGSIPPGTPNSDLIGTGTDLGLGWSSFPACDPEGNLARGLVGYWKMDEGTGTTVADSSGHGGTLYFRSGRPASWFSPGKEGNALKMYEGPEARTDSGAYVSQSNAAALNISGTQISFGGWIYLTAMPQSGSYGTFLQKNSIGYRLLIYPDGTSLVHINSKQVPEWGQGNTIGKDKWYFLFVTYDGENIKFYLDGDLRRTDPYDQPIGGSSGEMGIGKGEYPAIFGYIDEARVYNRALDPSEVSALYNNGTGCISP